MEAFKISVEVSVNLSENTQNFIKSLFNSSCVSTPAANLMPAESTPVKPATKPAAAEPTAKPAVEPISETTATAKNIEDVRAILAKKVNEHREVIKQKLNEFGAPSVTKLDPSKYDEMYNFLVGL